MDYRMAPAIECMYKNTSDRKSMGASDLDLPAGKINQCLEFVLFDLVLYQAMPSRKVKMSSGCKTKQKDRIFAAIGNVIKMLRNQFMCVGIYLALPCLAFCETCVNLLRV